MTKQIVVPEQLKESKRIFLYDREYDAEDGRFEVDDEVAERVTNDQDLVNPNAAYVWKVEDSDVEPVNVGKGKRK